MMDLVDYIEVNPADLVGKKFDNGFEIEEGQALAILKTYAPEKISDAVSSYTIDTIKGKTYLIGLTPNGFVDFMYEMKNTEMSMGDVYIDEQSYQCKYESRQYARLRAILSVCLAFLVVMAIFILSIIN